MAIRLRETRGKWRALCAAEFEGLPNDVYLDDNMHHALSEKFMNDFKAMGFIKKEDKRG